MPRRRRRKQKNNLLPAVLVLCFLAVVLVLALFRLQSGGGAKRSSVGISYTLDWSDSSGNKSNPPKYGEIKDALPEKLVNLYEKNTDARDYVLHYPAYHDQDFSIDLSEYKNTDIVPLLMQWDKRWGYSEYAGGLFGLTGCGPTSLSMVAIYLTGDPQYSPEYMRKFATENGYYAEGNGSTWTLFSEGAAQLGLKVTELPLDETHINDNLAAGNPIVCIMGPGHFTEGGHYIVLTGIQDGAYTVNDSNSFANSQRTWTYEEIAGEIRNLWAFQKG